ncbi:hypothetical protein GCM10009087_35490 [Sphingomonas oligophenolica]
MSVGKVWSLAWAWAWACASAGAAASSEAATIDVPDSAKHLLNLRALIIPLSLIFVLLERRRFSGAGACGMNVREAGAMLWRV